MESWTQWTKNTMQRLRSKVKNTSFHFLFNFGDLELLVVLLPVGEEAEVEVDVLVILYCKSEGLLTLNISVYGIPMFVFKSGESSSKLSIKQADEWRERLVSF